MSGKSAGDIGPGGAVIGGLEDERIAIVHQMRVDRCVRGARIEERRLDAGDRAPHRQTFDVLRHVVPMRAGIARVPDLPVVGAGPDQSLLDRRRGDREYHFTIKLPEVIAYDSARRPVARRVLRRKIGADDGPALSAVARFEDYLATVIDGVVIERIDRERRGPVATILGIARRRIERMHPRAHRSRELGLRVPAGHFVAIAGGPHDIVIGGIGIRESRFAAAHAAIPERLWRSSESAESDLRRWAAHGGRILHVGVEKIRRLIVDGDVIHLPDRQSDAIESAAVRGGDVHTGVMCDDEAIRIGGVPPDIVIVAAPLALRAKGFAGIHGNVEAAVGDHHFFVIHGRYREMNVVARAANQRSIPIHHVPVHAGVV